jgi:hypothetical protein
MCCPSGLPTVRAALSPVPWSGLEGPVQVRSGDAFAVLIAGLPVAGGGVLAGGDRLVEPAHLFQVGARLEELTEERLAAVAGTEPHVRVVEHQLNIDAARIVEYAGRDLPEHLRGLSPSRLEDLCALYLRVLGCDDVEVVGAATAGSLVWQPHFTV